MPEGAWIKGLPAAITVCNAEGIIVEMNDKACENFERYGGRELIGKSVLDCHPERAGIQIKEMLLKHTGNCYSIEKNGIKKIVYQTPWYKDGKFMGIVEIVFELPEQIPHFIR